jgi:acyl dehydratase
MPFPASAVGAKLERVERDITVRKILAYAAGLGAAEFLDDARPEGLEALPFQCVSPEWPALLSLRGALAGLAPEEAVRGVHVVQDSLFHRPMRPGDRLATTGQVVAVRASRAGVLTLIRLETRCRRTGEPVTTSWSSSIYRQVELEGEAQSLAEAPPTPAEAGQPLPDDALLTTLPIAREAAHVYSECAEIWNPIHTERAVALAAGLPGIILHGTATWALAGLTILRAHAGGKPARLKRLSGRFAGMVIPGETIGVRHARVAENLVAFEVLTQAGAKAIDQGFAVLG